MHKSHSKKHDKKFMKKALKLARLGLFTVGENPKVGCLIVKGDEIVGQGFHQFVGQLHAEALALKEAGDQAKDATAYVTLEPCSHHGRNPPCSEALIKAQVKRVVVCNDDPNPLVAGQGYDKLRAAGIEVITGILKNKGQALNAGFLHRMTTGLPWVRLKLAQSLDGRTAMANGDSFWITGKKARQDVQYWRGRSGAVVTGIGTVLSDDCRLTVRPDDLPKKYRQLTHGFNGENGLNGQPLRVVLDSHLRLPLDAKIIGDDGRCVVVTCTDDIDKINQLVEKGVRVLQMPNAQGQVDIKAVIKWLGEQYINEVLFECGATLAGQLVSDKLANEMLIYTAPVLMGSSARPLLNLAIEQMPHRLYLNVSNVKKLGSDYRYNISLSN